MTRGDITRDAETDEDHQHHRGSHLLLEAAWRSRCGAVRFARSSMSHVFVFQRFSPHFCSPLSLFLSNVTSLWKCSETETEVESVMFSYATHLLTKSVPPKYRIFSNFGQPSRGARWQSTGPRVGTGSTLVIIVRPWGQLDGFGWQSGRYYGLRLPGKLKWMPTKSRRR